MQFLHKEILIKEHTYDIINQAFVDDRKLYVLKHDTNEYKEIEISFVNISETDLFFTSSNINDLSLTNNAPLSIHFSVRYENRLLPCEISVRVKKFRLFDKKIFFSTTFPLSIRHLQRRLFARYPVKPNCFPSIQLAFTNTDYFLLDKWIFLPTEITSWGNISIGGMMCYLKKHECWEENLSYQSKIILNCIFSGSEKEAQKNLNTFYIVGDVLEINPIEKTLLKQIRVKFTHWTYQKQINWRKIHSGDGMETLAKFLFQYAYQNNINNC